MTSDFWECKITAVNGEDSYEVRLKKTGAVKSNVSAAQLRRLGSGADLVLEAGARVRAQYPGDGPQLYPATIAQDYGNGYYAISYDDGDFADQVAKSMIFAP